jgi:hypothetical protein
MSKGRTQGTDKDLRYIYAELNRKFFSNKLPKDMPVYFKKLKDDLGATTIHTQTFRPLYMRIEKRINFSKALCYTTILHEMVHVAHPEKRGHRGWFDKEMLKLAKKGAMNGYW